MLEDVWEVVATPEAGRVIVVLYCMSLLIALLGMVGLAFTTILRLPVGEEPGTYSAVRNGGNAAEGYRYLVTGDYIKSGIPYVYFLLGFGKTTANFLRRDSLNAQVSHPDLWPG